MSVLCFTWHKISWSCFSVVQIFCCFLVLLLQVVKSLAAVWETQVWSLGPEDPLEKEMATHSSFLPGKKPMDRGAWHGIAWDRRVRHGWVTSLYTLKLTSLKPLSPDWLVWMDEPFVFTVLYVTHSWTNENIPFLSCHKNINN